MKKHFLFCLAWLLVPFAGAAQVPDERPLDGASERQDYRISYRGVFTAYLWKDLADMSLYAFADSERFHGGDACRMTMTVDTGKYGFAEFSYPVHLRYDALLDEERSRVRLVSDHDAGVEDIHNFYWYNGEAGEMRGFRKRRYLPVNEQKKVGQDFFWEKQEYAWEADGEEELPEFLQPYPPVADGLSYLVHDRTVGDLDPDAVDPLGMLHLLRSHDYRQQPRQILPVIHKHKPGFYEMQLIGTETLRVAGNRQDALHVRMQKRANGPGSKGQLDVWLSNDEQRVILRMDIAAKVGKIRVDWQGGEGRFSPGGCNVQDGARLLTAGER